MENLLLRTVSRYFNALPQFIRTSRCKGRMVDSHDSTGTDNNPAIRGTKHSFVLPSKPRQAIHNNLTAQDERVGIGDAVVERDVVIYGFTRQVGYFKRANNRVSIVDDVAQKLTHSTVDEFHPNAVGILAGNHLQIVGAGPEKRHAVDIRVVRSADGVNMTARVTKRERSVTIDLVICRF